MAENEAEQISADDWAAAMAEQAGTGQPAADAAQQVAAAAFEELGASPQAAGVAVENLERVLDIPVTMTVELGRTRMPIRQLLQLGQGSVVELEGLAGEPMRVLVNGRLIAQGEVVVVNDKFGIRLTDIVDPTQRVNR